MRRISANVVDLAAATSTTCAQVFDDTDERASLGVSEALDV
jgi:hypothetical protein